MKKFMLFLIQDIEEVDNMTPEELQKDIEDHTRWVEELAKQDRRQWDQSLIRLGIRYLHKARQSAQLSRWLIEATTASIHATSPDFRETDWHSFKNLYQLLLSQQDNPFIRLNLAIATYYADGAEVALPLLKKLEKEKSLKDYHFLYATLGKVYKELGQNDQAIHAFHKASRLTKLDVENRFLNDQIQNITT